MFIEDDNCGLYTAEGLLVGLYTVLRVPGEGSFWDCIPIRYLEGGVVLGCLKYNYNIVLRCSAVSPSTEMRGGGGLLTNYYKKIGTLWTSW